MAELRIEELSKSYGGTPVLEDVSLTVPDGGFTIVLGPSGCGKSTLLRLVAGLDAQDQGRILIGGQEVSALPPRRRDVAMVFQTYALYPHLTVAGNLEFPLKMRGMDKAERRRLAGDAAQMLGIDGLMDRKPAQLSGGQRQRVAIGRALVRRPALFLFDEPLSNLDAQLRQGMRLELARLHRRLEASMVYVTHDQVEAMTLGREIVVLAQGKVQQKGPPAEIYARPANRFVAGFIGSPAINMLEGRVEPGDEGPVLNSPAARLSLPLPPEAAALAGRDIALGFRPEAVELGPGPIAARLELVERLGPGTVLHLKRGEVALRAEAGPDFPGRAGDQVELGCDPAGLHYFDAQGLRVSPGQG